ncbi:MAG: Entericidin EcnA/B family protein [Planctomycetes bacterium]|nr:Entericidin EcnA/B family protein [Planctomycetota bacterium]
MVRKVLLIITLIIAVFTVISCQTVQGIGNDITWMGQAGAEILEQ